MYEKCLQTGLGLFLYFWLLIFLDGLIARLLGSSKSHIHYSREEYVGDFITLGPKHFIANPFIIFQYIAEMGNDSFIAPPPKIRPPMSEVESTQEMSLNPI